MYLIVRDFDSNLLCSTDKIYHVYDTDFRTVYFISYWDLLHKLLNLCCSSKDNKVLHSNVKFCCDMSNYGYLCTLMRGSQYIDIVVNYRDSDYKKAIHMIVGVTISENGRYVQFKNGDWYDFKRNITWELYSESGKFFLSEVSRASKPSLFHIPIDCEGFIGAVYGAEKLSSEAVRKIMMNN